MGVSGASRISGIPPRTLRLQILQNNYRKPLWPAACLDSDAEMKISLIEQMQAAGFLLSRKDIRIFAFEVAQNLSIKY
jgi:hypothetical protein